MPISATAYPAMQSPSLLSLAIVTVTERSCLLFSLSNRQTTSHFQPARHTLTNPAGSLITNRSYLRPSFPPRTLVCTFHLMTPKTNRMKSQSAVVWNGVMGSSYPPPRRDCPMCILEEGPRASYSLPYFNALAWFSDIPTSEPYLP